MLTFNMKFSLYHIMNKKDIKLNLNGRLAKIKSFFQNSRLYKNRRFTPLIVSS
jgi:hypothetical protein